MQMFMRVAEAGSFVRAAETLSLPASTVTSTIKNLEKYLKVRLLNRTTRRVSLTPEGMQYLAQCREILALIEHSESSLSESVARPQGRLRVDMPAGIAHFIVMPHLPDFYRRYPDIYLMIGVSDRQVDLIQEGVDCVIRTGELNNSSLVARPLGRFRWVTCASPDYLGNMACRRHRRRSLSTGRCIISPARRGGPMSSASFATARPFLYPSAATPR
jgi:LysR family transcriptional regulator for bpeEF and oprC